MPRLKAWTTAAGKIGRQPKGIPELGLTAPKIIAATALASGMTMKASAQLAGVSQPTVSDWTKNEEFRRLYTKALRTMEKNTLMSFLQVQREATDLVVRVMRRGKGTGTKLQAAKYVLELSLIHI